MRANENIYEYLNITARTDILKTRNYLENYFQIFPNEHKSEIKNRIMTREQFDSTLFELFLYNKFYFDDFKITLHPKLNDTNNKPDFLLEKGDEKIFVEAKVDYNQSKQREKTERFKNEVIDNINRLSFGNYRINLMKMNIKSKQSPSLRKFKKDIKLKIENLGKNNSMISSMKKKEESYTYLYEDKNLFIRYKLYSVPNNYSDNRFIQMDASNSAKWLNSTENLKKSLESKSSRYGNLSKPFVIVLNSLDLFLDYKDIESAVLGEEKQQFLINNSTGQINSMVKINIDNGLFSKKN